MQSNTIALFILLAAAPLPRLPTLLSDKITISALKAITSHWMANRFRLSRSKCIIRECRVNIGVRRLKVALAMG